MKIKTYENKNDDGSEVSLKAMLSASKIDLKSITQVEHSHNIYDLIEKRVDIISAYTSKSTIYITKRANKI